MHTKTIFLGLLLIAASVFAGVSFVDPTPDPSAGEYMGPFSQIGVQADPANLDYIRVRFKTGGSNILERTCSPDATGFCIVYPPGYDYGLEEGLMEVTAEAIYSNSVDSAVAYIPYDYVPPEIVEDISVSGTEVNGFYSGDVVFDVGASDHTHGLNISLYYSVNGGPYTQYDSCLIDNSEGRCPITVDSTAFADGVSVSFYYSVEDMQYNAVNSSELTLVFNNNDPMITFDSPSDGSSFELGEAVEINFTAINSNSVSLYINGTEQGIQPTQDGDVYTFIWTPSQEGSYEVWAVASDEAGSAESEHRIIYITSQPQSSGDINISLSASPNPATEGDLVQIDANATPPQGESLTSLEIYINGQDYSSQANIDLAAGTLSYVWDTTGFNGTATIVVNATGDQGSNGSSTLDLQVNARQEEINLSFGAGTDTGVISGVADIEIEASSSYTTDATVYLNINDGSNNTIDSASFPLVAGSSATFPHSWDTTAYPDGIYTYYIWAVVNGNNVAQDSLQVTVDNINAGISVVITSPPDQTNIDPNNDSVAIVVNVSSNDTITGFTLQKNGVDIPDTIGYTGNETDRVYTYYWNASADGNGTYVFQASASNSQGTEWSSPITLYVGGQNGTNGSSGGDNGGGDSGGSSGGSGGGSKKKPRDKPLSVAYEVRCEDNKTFLDLTAISNDEPVSGVEVSLQEDGKGFSRVLSTDSQGIASFELYTSNHYTYTATKDGYREYSNRRYFELCESEEGAKEQGNETTIDVQEEKPEEEQANLSSSGTNTEQQESAGDETAQAEEGVQNKDKSAKLSPEEEDGDVVASDTKVEEPSIIDRLFSNPVIAVLTAIAVPLVAIVVGRLAYLALRRRF